MRRAIIMKRPRGQCVKHSSPIKKNHPDREGIINSYTLQNIMLIVFKTIAT